MKRHLLSVGGSVAAISVFALSMVSGAHAQFVCDGTAYISKTSANKTGLFALDTTTVPFVSTQVGDDPGVSYNAIGYNVADDFIYGIKNDIPRGLIRIDENGDVTDLGVPTGFVDQVYTVGTMDESGNLYVTSSTTPDVLYEIDVDAMTTTPINLVNGMMASTTILATDLSYNPGDGLLYGAWNLGAFGSGLQVIDPATGLTVLRPFTMGSPPTAGGVTWLDAAGNLFVNGGSSVRRIDVGEDPPTAVEVATIDSSGTNADGTSCLYALRFEKTVSPDSVDVAQSVTYTFELTNGFPVGSTNDPMTVSFTDTLPAPLTFDTATVNILNATGSPATSFSMEDSKVDIADIAVPGATTVVISIDAIVPASAAAPATLDNQAELTGVPTDAGGPTVLSDNPGGPSPDATRLELVAGTCLNGTVELSESCDDGDMNDANECNNSCRINTGSGTCMGASDCADGNAVCDNGTCLLPNGAGPCDASNAAAICQSGVCDSNANTCAPDADGDGIANGNDPDDDNDGIPDVTEGNGTDPSADANSNGVEDFEDPAAPGFVDTNSDGVDDRTDFDGDGVPNHLDLDSDGDGLSDALEGGADDMDGDGIPDGCDDADDNGVCDSVDADALPVPNTDMADGPDFLDLDSDDDGIADATEGHDDDQDGMPDTQPTGTDTDGDGLDDAFDPDSAGGMPASTPDADSDGTPDFQDVDDDGDGVDTVDEAGDANNNGVPDYLESGSAGTVGGGLAGGSVGCAASHSNDNMPFQTVLLFLIGAATVRKRRNNH